MTMAPHSPLEVAGSGNVPRIQIGVVVYRLSDDGKSLAAQWYHTRLDSNRVGSGEATRKSGAGFEGEFDISYATADGKLAGKFLLKIVKQLEVYALSWYSGEE